MDSLHFTAEEQSAYETELRAVHVHSGLGFLNSHNGLRRGSMHLVLGTTGGGKSTLMRTLIRDILFRKENSKIKLGLWLSEEEAKDYKQQLSFGVPSNDVLLNAYVESELAMPNNFMARFTEWIEAMDFDVLIFDNVTTSAMYMDQKADAQAAFAKRMKLLTKKMNCATIIVAHTDAEIHDGIERLININDIRGSKSICNLVEFAYILQRFELDKQFFPTIRIVKHRSQELIHSLYSLEYNKVLRSFEKDSAIEFKQFKEIFDGRNKLK